MEVQSLQPNIISVDGQLVIEQGVALYVERVFFNQKLNFRFLFLILFIEVLKISTVLLACPSDAEWYGALVFVVFHSVEDFSQIRQW